MEILSDRTNGQTNKRQQDTPSLRPAPALGLPLFVRPIYLGWLSGPVNPLCRAFFDPQGIGKETNGQPERQDQHSIHCRQHHSCLEIADAMRETFPIFPETPKHVSRLEERIDKGCDGRDLSQDEQHAENKQHDDHWDHPPALVSPEKRYEFCCNFNPSSGNL